MRNTLPFLIVGEIELIAGVDTLFHIRSLGRGRSNLGGRRRLRFGIDWGGSLINGGGRGGRNALPLKLVHN